VCDAPPRDDWAQARDLVDQGRIETIETGFAMSAADLGVSLIDCAHWNKQSQQVMSGYALLLTPIIPSTAFTARADHPRTIAGVASLA
jgi:hypothetical protein